MVGDFVFPWAPVGSYRSPRGPLADLRGPPRGSPAGPRGPPADEKALLAAAWSIFRRGVKSYREAPGRFRGCAGEAPGRLQGSICTNPGPA